MDYTLYGVDTAAKDTLDGIGREHGLFRFTDRCEQDQSPYSAVEAYSIARIILDDCKEHFALLSPYDRKTFLRKLSANINALTEPAYVIC